VRSSSTPRWLEALQSLTREDGLVVADRRDLVSQLNSTIQDTRHSASTGGLQRVGTRDGRIFGIGDPISTRRNDRELDVANRDTWVITGFDADFTVHVTGRRGHRALPPRYVDEHVELAYATTAYGAQGPDGRHMPTCSSRRPPAPPAHTSR
jgi:exodeoxyribonuclease V alpha subunit